MIEPIYHDLSQQIENYIREQGLEGRLPGYGFLGRKFGVNHQTVAKALHLLAARGIVSIQASRGTFVSPTFLHPQQHHVIGLVGLNVEDERVYLLKLLENEIAESGYHLLGITGSIKFLHSHSAFLSQIPVDGFVFGYSSLNPHLAQVLQNAGRCVVSCNHHFDIDDIDTVEFDHDAQFGKILQYLQQLGHRRIACLGHPVPESFISHTRWFNRIFRKNLGKNYHEELNYQMPRHQSSGPISPKELSRDVAEMLDYFLSLPEPPTAIVGRSDHISELSLQLEKRGIPVPEAMSLVSWCAPLEEKFSQVEFDYVDLWRHGVRMMLERLQNPGKPFVHEFLEMPFSKGATITAPYAPDQKKQKENGIYCHQPISERNRK